MADTDTDAQNKVDTIDAQLAAAALVKNTTFADQSTTFRDADDALKIRGHFARKATGNRGAVRYAATSKGC